MIRRTSWAAAVALILAAGVSLADPPSGFNPNIPTGKFTILKPDVQSLPAYNTSAPQTKFGSSPLYRITGNPGDTCATLTHWGSSARPFGNKAQPWNITQTLAVIANKDTTSTAWDALSPLLLDPGSDHEPVALFHSQLRAAAHDYRWTDINVSGYTSTIFNVTDDGDTLQFWNAATGAKLIEWPMPAGFRAHGFGEGEGNTSIGSRYIALCGSADGDHDNDSLLVIVDTEDDGPGPINILPDAPRDLGHVMVSASGAFVVLKYSDNDGHGEDEIRVLAVDLENLTTSVHTMGSTSPRTCGRGDDGWVWPLKHPDVARDPFAADSDIVVGGSSTSSGDCSGADTGARVVKINLATGALTRISSQRSTEQSFGWASCRNVLFPGWVYVTYAYEPADTAKRFNGEIVAYKLDGSGSIMRLAHHHSKWSGLPSSPNDHDFLSQPRAVPSPDGKMVMFGSNWTEACGSCGTLNAQRGFLLDLYDHTPPCEGEECEGGGGEIPPRPNGGEGGGAIPRVIEGPRNAVARYGPSAVWYDVMGRKIVGGPTRSGVYIVKVKGVTRRVVVAN